MDEAVERYPETVKEHFGTLIPATDNKFAALNTAVWSGGSYVHIPKGVEVSEPLQAYFRINASNMGQFERTMIIIEEDAYVHYVEGCTAPTYAADSLHSAVVEIFVKPRGRHRYTTIQNWSNNVYNLVTKRAKVESRGVMEWVDGNLGSKLTMKYPSGSCPSGSSSRPPSPAPRPASTSRATSRAAGLTACCSPPPRAGSCLVA